MRKAPSAPTDQHSPSAPFQMYPNIEQPPSYNQGGATTPFIPEQPPVIQNVIMGTPQVGPNKCTITCPSCRQTVVTRLNHTSTSKTHTIALLLCLFCCCLCAWIPYCCANCKNTNHYCPNCNAFIGSYQA